MVGVTMMTFAVTENGNKRTILRSESMEETNFRFALTDLYNDILDANFDDKYVIKEAFYRLIRINEKLIDELDKTKSQ